MDCKQIRPLIAAHLDGELDVVTDAAVVAHFDHCPACADAALAHASSRGLVQEKLTRYVAPEGLADAIHSALSKEPKEPARSRVLPFTLKALALAASLAIVATTGYQWGAYHERGVQLLGEIESTHVRALMTGHTFDVASSDQHTVKPWFAGKLDFSPTVSDLAAEGFLLTGGRVDRIGGRAVAALVYGRRKHTIDLYIWTGAPELRSDTTTRNGYNIVSWTKAGQNFVAISDVSTPDLNLFSDLQKKAAAPGE